MADVELVIKIPERIKDAIDRGQGERMYNIPRWLCYSISNGTPLPEGHGRLIDANEVSKYVIIGNGDLRKCQTIIKADKESEEEE